MEKFTKKERAHAKIAVLAIELAFTAVLMIFIDPWWIFILLFI